MNSSSVMLSVIIPTRNRADLLKSALQSLETQTLPSNFFEVLVIDNGSTDNTRQVVELARQRLGNVRYFYDPTPGLHVGRHLGMKMAESDILVYADDDIEAFPTWLEAIAESFQDPEVVLVGGKNLPKWESEPPEWILKMWEPDKNGDRVLGYLSILDLGNERKFINPFYVFGCNFSIRKKILLEAGGFHPDAFPQELIKYRGDGESHVSRYISDHNYKALYHPQASVYHIVPSSRLTEDYFCQRAHNQGISDSYTKIRLQHLGDNNKRLLLRYCRVLKKMAIGKWLKLLIRQIGSKILTENGDEISFIKKKIQKAYLEGWNYHQQLVKRDLSLLGYVIRENYYDEL